MISITEIENFKKKFDVVSAFVEHDGEMLLLHRQDHKPQGNTWSVPAGKVEEGEDFLEALRREIGEEIGVKTERKDYVFFETYYVRYPTYDFMYHVYHLPLDTKPSLTVNLEETKDTQWLPPQEALKLDLIPDEDECIRRFYNIK